MSPFIGDLHSSDGGSSNRQQQKSSGKQTRDILSRSSKASNVEDLVDVEFSPEEEEEDPSHNPGSTSSKSPKSSASLNKTQSIKEATPAVEQMKRTNEQMENEKKIRLKGHEESRIWTTKRQSGVFLQSRPQVTQYSPFSAFPERGKALRRASEEGSLIESVFSAFRDRRTTLSYKSVWREIPLWVRFSAFREREKTREKEWKKVFIRTRVQVTR